MTRRSHAAESILQAAVEHPVGRHHRGAGRPMGRLQRMGVHRRIGVQVDQPLGGRERPGYLADLMGYFARLGAGYRAIRARHALRIWEGFMCHRCAYMQLECDVDRALDGRRQAR